MRIRVCNLIVQQLLPSSKVFLILARAEVYTSQWATLLEYEARDYIRASSKIKEICIFPTLPYGVSLPRV